MEEDDDFYGDDSTPVTKKDEEPTNGEDEAKDEKMDESLEEGEEEEDSDDSDVEIITESKDAPAPELSRGGSFNQPFNKSEPARTTSTDPSKAQGSAHAAGPSNTGASKAGAPSAPQKPGSAYPDVRTSTIDVDGNPVYEPAGKPINEVDIDADLQEHDKPWRLPGADQSDYFNYGFDEFTWTLYCLKQRRMADEIKASKGEMGAQMAQFEMLFGGMPPGMGGPPAGPGGNGPPVGAPTGPSAQQGAGGPQGGAPNGPGAPAGMMAMPPMDENMMQMLQSFRAQGIDPSQLSFDQMAQMMQGMPQGPAAAQQGGFGAQGGQQGQFGGGYQGGFRGGRGGRRW